MLTSNDIEFIRESSKDLSINQLCHILKVDKKEIEAYIPEKYKNKCINPRNEEYYICAKCGEEKHKLAFGIDPLKKNNLTSWCKSCFNENTKSLYREKIFSLETNYQREIKPVRKYNPLTEQDKEYIKENILHMTQVNIAKNINNSLYNVRKYCTDMKLNKEIPLYQNINRDLIKEFVSQAKTVEEMSSLLNMSASVFRQYLIHMGISIVELKNEVTAELIASGLSDEEIRKKLCISSPTLWARKNTLKKNSEDIIKNNLLNSLLMVKMPISKDVIKNSELIENKLNELLELIEKGA